jgi:hypothetical protein
MDPLPRLPHESDSQYIARLKIYLNDRNFPLLSRQSGIYDLDYIADLKTHAKIMDAQARLQDLDPLDAAAAPGETRARAREHNHAQQERPGTSTGSDTQGTGIAQAAASIHINLTPHGNVSNSGISSSASEASSLWRRCGCCVLVLCRIASLLIVVVILAAIIYYCLGDGSSDKIGATSILLVDGDGKDAKDERIFVVIREMIFTGEEWWLQSWRSGGGWWC